MGMWLLRIPVWFNSLSAIIGNLLVIIVIATSHFRLTVSKFLMCNLAIADLCIGIHLVLIAFVDACSIGVYFNYAIDWQEGNNNYIYQRINLIIIIAHYSIINKYDFTYKNNLLINNLSTSCIS